MTAFGALNHLINLFLPALGVALLAAALAKLLWRRELVGVPWARLALGAAAANAVVLLAGLVVFQRDGKMATYGTMLLVNALTLWWLGFGSRSKRG
jgi:glucose-6-phosphate-specific signal transduction histidine kinase